MAAKESIILQPYLRGRGAAVIRGAAVACRSAEEASRRADKAMAGGKIVGVHVIRVVNDEAAGDYGDPEYILSLGSVWAVD